MEINAIDAGYYEQESIWGTESVVAPEYQLQRFEAIERLLPKDVNSVLDVGAGDGRVLHHLASARSPAPLLIAAERSGAALAHVRQLRVRASAEALPFRDRSVDTVLCCEVLEHLPPPVYDAARAELARVALSCVLITVPNRERRGANAIRCESCGCVYNPDRHLRSFGPAELSTLIPGFETEAIEEVGPRALAYPRFVRLALERLGLLWRPGKPQCPQCGTVYRASRPQQEPTGTADSGLPRRSYALARRLAPRRRHRYWLAVSLRRSVGER